MKISLNWLTDYVEVSMSAAQLGELLTRVGLNLEEIIETETDIVLDLEVGTNRPDCLGHLGVAREIAAVTGAAFKPPKIKKPPTSGKVEELTGVEVLDPQLCPRYTARVIRGVKVGPSPDWMVERLEAVGLRSVNNIVDATNYVLMEYSQPLHSFDYDKLAEGRIIVRRAKGGEQLVSIDKTTCRLDEQMLVIADAQKAVAVAGVMGGLNSEVTDSTTNVLIESAQFDPLSVRHASRTLQLMSESNYRFERGVDPVAVDEASLRACQLICELAGGKLAEGVADVWGEPYRPRQVSLRPGRTNALLGIDLPAERQLEILKNLGLSPSQADEKSSCVIVCEIPSHRPDLRREVDLIEEVARMEGYDSIPTARKVLHAVCREGLNERTRREIGRCLTAAGFDETITFTFTDVEEARLFGYDAPLSVDPLTRKTNNVLRPTILPSLLRACKTNQDAGNADVSLWELATVFAPADGSGEQVELAMATTGPLSDLRGALEAVIERIDPDSAIEVVESAAAGLAEGASAEVLLDGERIGRIGCIAPAVLKHYGLERDVSVATVSYDALLGRAGGQRTYKPLGKFPPIRRDLSLILDESITWRQLSEAIAAIDQPTRVAVDFVTIYRGKQIPTNRKSVTVTLTYRSASATLRGEQVEEQVAELVSALSKKLGAELRT